MIPLVPGDASAPEGETPRCLATPAHPRDPSLLRDLLRKTMSERRFSPRTDGYLHKAIGSGRDFASALALGQQRPHSWNHPCGPAVRSGTSTADSESPKLHPHTARVELRSDLR